MKKLIFVSLLVFMVASSLSYGQAKYNSTKSIASGKTKPGLMNITELNAGIGLYELNRDYAKRVANLTSILGIGLTRNLTGGIGVGVSLYNGGTLVPLFADFRYFFNLGKTRFFAFGDGGILLNSAKTEGGTKYLVSPGVGLVLPVSKNLSINLGAYLFTQFGYKDYGHDSFANIKLGMTYLFKKN
jgi:hypothetical protein